MVKFYITFGQIHKHTINGVSFDKDTVGVFYCNTEDWDKASDACKNLFNNQYCHVHKTMNEEVLQYYPKGLVDIPINKKHFNVR